MSSLHSGDTVAYHPLINWQGSGTAKSHLSFVIQMNLLSLVFFFQMELFRKDLSKERERDQRLSFPSPGKMG